MRVGPHPHIGLQTFTWMIEGEVLHRDSLGNVQMIRPGQVNLMTAGRGIAHTEESADGETALHAVQLWIALRSEEHTSELQSLMRISYAVFCLKTKKKNHNISQYTTHELTTERT